MPIDVGSGAVHLEVQDIGIRGRFPLLWGRRYHTSLIEETNSPFGAGWTCSNFAGLTRIGKDYHFRAPSGALIVFPDSLDTVERTGTIRDLGSFHEITRKGNSLQVTQWTASGKVTHYKFLPGKNGSWWPINSVEDSAGNGIESSWDDAGRLKGIRQKREKRTLAVAYSASGRITTVSFRHTDGRETVLVKYEYDAGGRLASCQDALGSSVRYEYDREGRLFREIAKDGGVFTYKYDDKGRCIRYSGLDNYDLKVIRYLDHIKWTEITNSLGSTRRYEWLPTGQIIQEIEPLGGRTLTEYDNFGRIVSKTDPMGAKTQFEYDEFGNRTKIIDAVGNAFAYEYNNHHLVTCEIDANGGRWERIYDESNRTILATSPVGFRYSIGYDPIGNPIEIKKSDGALCKRKFSGSGDLVETTDWEGRVSSFIRDDFGRIVRRRNPNGMEFAYQFDLNGRITMGSDNQGRQVKFEYDKSGNLIKRSGTTSASVSFRYGTCNRLLEKKQGSGPGLRFKWGSEPDRLEAVTNEKGEQYTFIYDPCDRVNKEIGFDGHATTFKFDLSSHCIRKTNAAGQSIAWILDPLGRILEEELEGGEKSSFQYDKLGNIISAENAMGKQIYERDTLGRILKEDQFGFGIRREYGFSDEVLRLDSDAGIELGYEYDGNGHVRSITAAKLGSYAFTRNSGAQISTIEMPGDLRFDQTYDARGRLVNQALKSPDSGISDHGAIMERSYSYDDSDMLLEDSDSRWDKSRFTHDQNKRLIQFRTDSFRSDYRLDSTGDPTSILVNGEIETFLSYHPGGALAHQGQTEFQYDGAGRLVWKYNREEKDSSRKWAFRWDAKDCLRSVQTPSGETWEYGYDPFGRRILKKGPNEETRFVWDGNVLLHEIATDQAPITWGFEPKCFKPLFKIQAGEIFSIITDRLGTPCELVDKKGKVVWGLRLDPWGNAIEGKGLLKDCPFRFQGQYFDSETGLHYNNFRYYDPANGRFISEDPIRLLGGMSPYQYVHNPVHWVDPLGLCPEDDKKAEELAALQAKFEALAEEQLLPKYRELDPNLEAGFTGSFKTGKVGNPQKPTYGDPVNLSKFDVDYWIKSDVLYEKFGKNLRADPEFRQTLAETPGFEGLKPNKEGFSIKFKPSSE